MSAFPPALADGSVTITASLTDSAGNTGSDSHTVTVNTALPSIDFNSIAGDNVLNAIEKGEALTISGTSSGLAANTAVTISLNGHHYTTATDTSGNWTLNVPSADLAGLGEANYIVSVSASNSIGNTASNTANLLVDTATPSVTINSVTSDDMLNAAEIAVNQTISGRVTGAEAGSTVTITLGGVDYTATVQPDLTWSLNVAPAVLSALGDGDLTITSSVTNTHGNTGTGSRDISVDASLPGLRINTVAGDDIINAIEHNQNLIVSGTSTGLVAGGTVVVTINGETYNASVNADGTWSASVPASDVSAWTAGNLTIAASAADAANNPVSIQHQVMVDLAPVAISIDPVTSDNVLNASEKGAGITLSGTVDNVEDGQTVNVIFAGHHYITTVQTGGTWSVNVPAADILNQADGNVQLQVSVTNAAGNSASAAQGVHIDTAAPALIINSITSDDVLNAIELLSDLTLSGTSTAEAGQMVNITFNGGSYTATVQADGTWSTTVPDSALTGLTDGTSYTVSATVSDKAGNTSSADRTVIVDIAAVTVTINTIAGDDIINLTEHAQAQVISGSSTGAAAGDSLTVTIAGQTYTTTVDAAGNWQVVVPANVIATLADGTATITATLTDAAGNSGSDSRNIDVDTGLLSLSFDAISGDNVLNAIEKGTALTVSGVSANLAENTIVTITLNGQNYTAIVAADGTWNTSVPATALSVLDDVHYTLTASASNGSGNTASNTATILVDSSAPALTINTISGDDIINAAESAAALTISGTTTAEAGQTVTISFNGTDYTAAVNSDGTWSTSVPATGMTSMADGGHLVSAAVSDNAGNSTSTDRHVTVDKTVPTITFDPITGDDVINATEHGQAQVITGTSTGAAAGNVLTLIIDGNTYTTTVDGSGNWSVGVPASVIFALNDGTVTITASLTDSAGNTGSGSHHVVVDSTAPTLTIDAIATDNVLNAIEKVTDLTISGSSDLPANTTITVSLNGQTYTTTTTTGGNWTLDVPASHLTALGEANYTVTVSAADGHGNIGSNSANLLVDTALPIVIIDNATADNILNAAEIAGGYTLTGSVTGAQAGNIVTITLGGSNNFGVNNYSVTVQSDLTWSLTLTHEQLAALGDGAQIVSASVTNTDGNTGNTSHDFTIDADLPTLGINTVAGDDIINAIERGQNLIISGTSDDIAVGSPIVVNVNGINYNTTVNSDGSWSVGIAAANVAAWQEGTVIITASGVDSAANPVTTQRPVIVDVAAVAVSIDTVAGDNVLNAAEKGGELILSGSTLNVEAGQPVYISFADHQYTAIVAADGSWTFTVPAIDMAALADGNTTVSVSTENSAGNPASAAQAVTVDTTAPMLTINTIAGDDVVNAAEIAQGIIVNGTSTAEAGQVITIRLIRHDGSNEEIDYGSTTVQPDGTWSFTADATYLSSISSLLSEGSYIVQATVSDNAGNTASAEHHVIGDITPPEITFNTVAGDDIINSAERGQALIISGSSTGADAGNVLTLTIDGHTYTTTVDSSGNWSVGVPADVVAALADGSVTISANMTDSVGNSGSADHIITVDTQAPTLTIDAVTADDVVNAAEKAAGLTLSGTTTNIEAGRIVTVQIAGVDHQATVQTNGIWTVNIPPAYLANLHDGDLNVTAHVSNAAGNSANAAHVAHVDTTPPALTIDTITSDNILNALEVGENLTVTGTSTAQAGQHVTITLNSANYDALVNSDGTWSTTIPSGLLSSLAQGYINVTAEVADQAGNSTSTVREIWVDTVVPTININAIAIDDIINAAEHSLSTGISGTTTGALSGDVVTVTIGSYTFTTIVNANGTWSVGVPPETVSGLADGSYSVTATVKDSAGNIGSGSRPITVETALPQLTINTLADDDIINAAEKGQPLTISGTSDQPNGTVVSVTLNGTTYDAAVNNGLWSLIVPPSMVAALGEANYTVTASVTAANGNTSNAAHNVLVDSVAPVIRIDAVTNDDVLNSIEVSSGHTFTGSVTGVAAGTVVSVIIGGESYSATVASDQTWSVTLTAAQLQTMGDGHQVISVSVTDTSGNTGDSSHDFEINANLPGIHFNTISGDDIINAIELHEDLYISGTSDDFNMGNQITITVNNQSYNAVVNQDGSWIVQIPSADVAGFPDGVVRVTAEGENSLGNTVSAAHLVTVDSTGVAITVDTIAADDIINAVEKGQPLTLSGKVSDSVEVGQTVVISFGGDTYLATVQTGGNWSCVVPVPALASLPEGHLAVSVSVINQAGNSASAGRDVTVDTTAPVISIDPISGDNMLNALEKTQDLVISGTSYGLESGRPVTVSLNGQDYITTVDDNGNWLVTVPNLAVASLTGTETVAVQTTDRAGNSSSAQSHLVVDITPPALTIDNITDDNIINLSEHNTAQVVSGTSDAIGQIVTVTIGGESYTTQVRLDGTWVIGVPKVVINSLASGSQDIVATVNDSAGNQTNVVHSFDVEGGLPSLSIATVALDDVINALEQGSDLVISGSSSELDGQPVTVRLNGTDYSATINAGGSWSVTIPQTALSAMADGSYQITVNAVTAANTPASAAKTIEVDTQAPTLTLNPVAGDDIINAQEHGAAVVLSGTYGNVEVGQTISVTLNGQNYTFVTTGTGGAWSVTVPIADVAALADGFTGDVTVNLSDAAGNPAQITQPISVDLTAPIITITPVTGDNILSADETSGNISISGTTDAPVGQPLVVTFNGRNYSTSVNSDGSWSVDVPAAHLTGIQDGQYQVSVTVSDIAGNVGSASQSVTVTSVPPVLVINSFAGDDWVNIAEHGQAQALSGTSDAIGQQVTIHLNDKNYVATVQANGTWSVNITVADMAALAAGTAIITATVANSAGNSTTATHNFEVDLTPPTAITIDGITQDTGESASDFITADNNFTLHGSLAAALEAGAKAQISLDNGATWIDLTVSGTQWSYANASPLADGSYNYQVRLIDEAGNTGPVDSETVVVDTIDPVSNVTIVSYTDDAGQRQGVYGSGSITDDTTPLLNGVLSAALAAGEYIEIYRDGVLIGRATMTSSTTWTFSDSALASATYQYVAKIVDAAGNEKESNTFDLIVDTYIPTTIAEINPQTTGDTTPIISGTLSDSLINGQYLDVSINGVTYSSDPAFGGAVVVDPNNKTWYLQIPDNMALGYANYIVTTQVKSGAGNGNNAYERTGSISIVNDDVAAPAAGLLDGGSSSNNNSASYTATYGLGSNGLWEIFANGKNTWATDQSSYSVGNSNKPWSFASGTNGQYINGSFADYNRDGYADVIVGRDAYNTQRVPVFTANGSGGYTSSSVTLPGSVDVWYGAIVAFDYGGDGYLDFYIGDAGGPDSSSYIWNNNGVLNTAGADTTSTSITIGGTVGNYQALIEASGVDLNNDGKIDLVQHIETNTHFTLATLINQGNGSHGFIWGQEIKSAFVSNDGSAARNDAVSMTWADFNGDGSMDLFMPMSRLNGTGTANLNQGVLMLNNGSGQLGSAVAVGGSYASNTSVAADWDHDGDMDIIKLASAANTASIIYLNNGNGTFTASSQTIAGMSSKVSGAALMDYDWDGAQDLMIFRQTASQSVTLVRNTNEVADGTSIHLKIMDSQGMNVFYGNTVNLYDSQGHRVASQIINPQSGIGINDASSLLSFYGLNANETYHAELVRAIGTTSANVTWDGLTAGDATHNYVLSAAAASGNHNDLGVGTVGTGYNDTFIADTGTHIYNGSGGWEYSSNHGTWVANGGQDIVDFINSTVGITADLSNSNSQNTGYNSSVFKNIEGIAGSNLADTITGSSGNNIFEGRGGNDTFNIGNGGHDTLLYKLLNNSDATGGNGKDTINGFSVGTFEGTADSDRIDISELLQGSGYSGNAGAHYINGVAVLDTAAGNIADFIKVNVVDGNTEIAIDRDGNGGNYSATTIASLTSVQTDLATLLANHQLMVI
jgi:hypothetical protein